MGARPLGVILSFLNQSVYQLLFIMIELQQIVVGEPPVGIFVPFDFRPNHLFYYSHFADLPAAR